MAGETPDSGRKAGPDRLGTARIDGAETVVLAYGDDVYALADLLGDAGPGTARELIADWDRWAPDLETPAADARPLDLAATEWAPPVMPAKLICVGANYYDHVAEMEAAGGPKIPKGDFPFSFFKPPTTALAGSGAEVTMPTHGERLDWEAELAVVIGDPMNAAEDPMGAVFGYSILDDLSFRDFVPFPHPLGLDVLISKGFDGAAPMGPWITRADRVDPTKLAIRLRVNGDLRQDSSTDQMMFPIDGLISYYAQLLTLEPGDVIATGTPAGVGNGMKPQQYLSPGDEIEIEIDGLGELVTTIGPPGPPVTLKID